jgi:hypothetical protein
VKTRKQNQKTPKSFKMRFTVSAVLAMATTVLAQTADFNPIYKPESQSTINAGSTFEITWEAPAKYAEATVSIHLIGGVDQDHQVPLLDIASGIKNSANKYSWTVAADLGAANVYGLIIRDESNPEVFQYSNPFHIKASAVESSKTTAVSTSAAQSSSAAADATTTVHSGAVTVTLSSCTTSSVPVTTSQPVISTPIVIIPSSSAPSVNTTLSTKPIVPPTSAFTPPAPTGPAPSAQTPPGQSGAAAGSVSFLALIGAAAMAMLTL